MRYGTFPFYISLIHENWQDICYLYCVQIIGEEYLAIRNPSSGRFVGGKLGPAFFM